MHCRIKIVMLAGFTLTWSGCNVGPDYHNPNVTMPAAYDTGPATQASTAPAADRPVDMAHWWKSLNDPELDSLVDRCLAANLDLKISVARIQEARAAEMALTGGTLPFIEANGGAARGSGTNSAKGRVAGPLNAGTNTTGLHEITQVVGFDAGWEIDLFGRYRRQLEAASADLQAISEARNAILITAVSDVARAYVDMRTAQLRLDIAQQNIAGSKETLDLVSERYRRGFTNELDVALARRQVATEEATVAPLAAAITQTQRRIAVLLGISPDRLYAELNAHAPLPDPRVKVIAGLPADLLQRRPDIREAERRLAAENARIGVATADLFPRIVLTAGYGLQGQGLGRTPSSNSMIWSVGPTASLPLLDFGRIDSFILVENLRTQELFYNYQRIILSAVAEVDDAISNYEAQVSRLENLATAVEASKQAISLASGRYDRGLIDFLNVLDAQRQLYELQDQYTVAQQSLVMQYVSLYKSLGGGWEAYQAIPATRDPKPAVMAAGAQILGSGGESAFPTAPPPRK